MRYWFLNILKAYNTYQDGIISFSSIVNGTLMLFNLRWKMELVGMGDMINVTYEEINSLMIYI